MVPEPTGQVYAGLVNGACFHRSPYDALLGDQPVGNATSPYVPYNAKNLNIGTSSPSTQVNLSGVYNVDGISTDNNPSSGNLDRAGDSYSADALGTTVTWGGATFNIGAATTNNVVQMGGVPINLPQGNYTNIKLLGTGTHGVQPGTFIVHYTDGTTASFTQAFSDWMGGYTGGGPRRRASRSP